MWIAFAAASAVKPSLGRRHREVVELTRQRIRYVIELGQERTRSPLPSTPEWAAVAVAATVDGLLVHAITDRDHTASWLEAQCDHAVTTLLGLGAPPSKPAP